MVYQPPRAILYMYGATRIISRSGFHGVDCVATSIKSMHGRLLGSDSTIEPLADGYWKSSPHKALEYCRICYLGLFKGWFKVRSGTWFYKSTSGTDFDNSDIGILVLCLNHASQLPEIGEDPRKLCSRYLGI